MSDWYIVDIDKVKIKKQRDKQRLLKKTSWWSNIVATGICYYCKNKFAPKDLTMDHIVPIARGGKSTKSNIVPSCKKCNTEKKLKTPVEDILDKI